MTTSIAQRATTLLGSSLIALAAIFIPVQAGAEQITVLDANGITRAAGKIDGMGRLEFSLVDAHGLPADGIQVSLTNTTTGETLHAVAANGRVVFDAVGPGAWTVATDGLGVTFVGVEVGTAASAVAGMAGAGASTALTVAGTGAVAAAAGAAINEATDSGRSGTPLSPAQ